MASAIASVPPSSIRVALFLCVSAATLGTSIRKRCSRLWHSCSRKLDGETEIRTHRVRVSATEMEVDRGLMDREWTETPAGVWETYDGEEGELAALRSDECS